MSNLDFDNDNADPDTPPSFDAVSYIRRQQQASLVNAWPTENSDPDKAARAMELSKATGVPASIINANQESFEQQHQAALTSRLLNNNKFLMDYAADPMSAKVSSDDWGQLDTLSSAIVKLRNSPFGRALDAPTSIMGAAATGFRRGMEEAGPVGQWADPELLPLPRAEMSGITYLPELTQHVFQGILEGVKSAAAAGYTSFGGDPNQAEQFGNETAAMAEAELMGLSGRGHTAHPTEGAARAQSAGKLFEQADKEQQAQTKMVQDGLEAFKIAEPYLRAGEVPPMNLHPLIDKLHMEQSKLDMQNLKEAGQEANKTNTIERPPESFRRFVDIHSPGRIEIQADALRSIYGDDPIVPGDERFGDVPGINEELALAERHNGHVQVPLADWLLFQNKKPEEAKFLEKYATLPGGVTEAEGELAKERKAAAPTEEEPIVTLEKGKWAGDQQGPNDHVFNITDNRSGNIAGNIQVTERDSGKELHVDYMGSEGGPGSLGVAGIKAVRDELAKQFPDARFITAYRDTGAREEAGVTQTYTRIPINGGPRALAMRSIRDAAGLNPLFVPREQPQSLIPETASEGRLVTDSGEHTVKIFQAKEAMALVDKEQLTGVPRALAEFFHDRLDRLAGDTAVWVAPTQLMKELNKAVRVRPNVPGFYYPDKHAIVMREDAAGGMLGHDVATHILIHEVGHAATYNAMREFPAIKEMVGNLMGEADKYLREQAPEDRKAHDYAFKDADEFVAEAFSNPKFQEVLATTPLSNELASRLGLNAKSSSTWDAVKQIVANLIERLTGVKLPPTILDGMMRVGEAFEEAAKFDPNKEQRQKRDGVHQDEQGNVVGAQEREPQLPGITRMESRGAFRTPGATGLSADALRKYMGLIEKQNEVEAKHIESKAHEDERRRQTAEWKENEKSVRAEVREGVNRRPDIAADRFLREGILEGKKAGNFKLDKGALTDEQLRSLPPDYYSSGGANPDDMARLFGYQSGDALVAALGQLNAQREMEGLTPAAHISKMVDVGTEHEMQRQHGDLEENILREAKEHVFSSSQIDILADETIHLASLAGSELPISKEDLLKGARQVFDASPLRAISSKAFEASAGRAGQAVQDALLKGDYRAALKAKQEQTNAAIYANLALKFEKGLKRFKETDAPRWGRREPPGVPQEDAVWMHQILMQVMGPDGIQTSRQDLERRKEMSSPYASLRDYVEAKNRSNGTASTDPDNPPITHALNVMPDLFSTNWPGKDFEGLSAAEFQGVYDSLKSINHYGHEANKYEVKGNKEDLAGVVSGLVERLKAAVDNKPAVSGAHEESKFRTIGSLLLNTETWLNRLDLGNRQGPFNQLIMRPITEGQNYLRQLNRDFAAKWKDLGPFPDFNKKINNTMFRTDDGRFIEMTKGQAYAVLQNMGNALQRRKLIEGWNISKDQDTGEQMVWHWLKNVAGMGPEDLARAGKMGKVFSDAFNLAEHAYVHTAGVAPARIELYKVRTPWGDADEWYHPLIADPLRHSSKMTVDDMMGDSGYWKPSPASGYTKTRTGARYPIDLSFESAAFKLKQILNDAAMRIPITEVSKIVYNKEFMSAFKEYYGPEYHSALDAWMKDAAGNRQWQPANMRALDRWVNALAQNMSTMMIGFNPGTVAKHGLTAGVFSSWEVGFGNWASSMLHMIHELPGSRERWKFAMDNSEEIRNRLHSIQDTIVAYNKELFGTQRVAQGRLKAVTGHPAFTATQAKLVSFRDAVNWYGHAPVGMGDLLSAVSMWDAEYRRLNKSDPDMTHGDLVYASDTAVRRTHGSSILTNRSAVQRHQSPFVRLIMPFYTFLSNALQRNYELAWKAKLAVQGRELPEMPGFLEEKFDAGPQHILPIMGGVAVFGLAVGLIEHLVSGQPKKQDESEGAHLAKILLRGYPAQVPLVRDVSNYLIDGHDPSIGLYGSLAQDVKKSLTTKNYDYRTNPGKAFRTAGDVLSVTTGLTTQSADKLGEYLINVLAGHEHPKGFGDLWTGIRTGTQQAPRR